MASKRRIKRNQCGKKRKYDSEEAARQAIHHLSVTAGPIGFMKAYRCQFCSHYHIGHAKKVH